jgi:FdrA protein
MFASTMRAAAEMAVQTADMQGWNLWQPDPDFTTHGIYLRALFSGGTLAYEALLGLQAVLAPLYSNIPISPGQRLPDPLSSQAHTVLDLGEDLFTVGRLHPMIDNDLRLRRLRQEAADPEVGIIFLDVVLGEGAHPDPASELAPVIAEVKRQRDLEVVAVVVGTDADPQNLGAQVDQLTQAGTRLFGTIGEAVNYIGRQLGRPPQPVGPPVSLEYLDQQPLAAINVGLESFYDSLVAQGASAVQVDWRPPAGGNERLMAILAKMKK